MSFTMRVPAGVPSLHHSSVPLVPPKVTKASSLPSGVSSMGAEEGVPGRMSAAIAVPAAVPSLDHNSKPKALV